MKYKQPIVVLTLLLIILAVALVGFLLIQRNQEEFPLVIVNQPVRSGQPSVNPTPGDVELLPSEDGKEDGDLNNMDVEPEIITEPEVIEIEVLAPTVREFNNKRDYKIVAGDTVSTITVREWGDIVLWPDLYVSNQWLYNDPDLILPGEVIMIFDKLGHGSSELTTYEKEELLNAYLKVYHLYNRLGEKRNASKWYTLGLALRVEPKFFEIYASEIDARDIEMVKSLNRQASAFQ